MVESELLQHVFEILDSDWLCDEVTSNTTLNVSFAISGTKKRVTLREPGVRAEFLGDIYFS